LYWLADKGKEITIPKYLYNETLEIELNKPFKLKENEVIHKTNINITCNVVELDKKSRYLFNKDFTILEIDDKNIKFAERTFETLSTETKDDVVIFFCD
jgi:hypothetical protein